LASVEDTVGQRPSIAVACVQTAHVNDVCVPFLFIHSFIPSFLLSPACVHSPQRPTSLQTDSERHVRPHVPAADLFADAFAMVSAYSLWWMLHLMLGRQASFRSSAKGTVRPTVLCSSISYCAGNLRNAQFGPHATMHELASTSQPSSGASSHPRPLRESPPSSEANRPEPTRTEPNRSLLCRLDRRNRPTPERPSIDRTPSSPPPVLSESLLAWVLRGQGAWLCAR
jgi:hypothetical protein